MKTAIAIRGPLVCRAPGAPTRRREVEEASCHSTGGRCRDDVLNTATDSFHAIHTHNRDKLRQTCITKFIDSTQISKHRTKWLVS